MLTPDMLQTTLAPARVASRWWLGLSGGVDSLVLLHLLSELRPRPPLRAVYIHHGLYAEADEWADRCREVCDELGVELVVRRVTVSAHGQGEEAEARRARYAAFTELLAEGEVLLLAHHRDDQIETLLMRLLRGAGVEGLSGMPAQRPLGRGLLLRPLLPFSREQIVAAARQRGLCWVNDPSNHDPRLERGFLREQLLPVLAQRWPDYPQRLLRSLEHLIEAQAVLDDQAATDLQHCDYRADDHSVALPAVTQLSPARQHNMLRYWLRKLGLPPPAARAWAQWPELVSAAADSEPGWRWADVELRRFRNRLYPLAGLPALGAAPLPAWQPPFDWQAADMGVLHTEPVHGCGLRADRAYHIERRRGGERCRPQGRSHSQTLKKLFQEYAVPPWWRDRVPLIYCGADLAAVGDYWICDGFVAPPGINGWSVQWSPPGAVTSPPLH